MRDLRSLRACALVSTASVATTPMVVAMPACSAGGRSLRRIDATAPGPRRPSSVRVPATTAPEAGSITSPTALTATTAPTVTRPIRAEAVPMPPLVARSMPNSLPTVAPAPCAHRAFRGRTGARGLAGA